VLEGILMRKWQGLTLFFVQMPSTNLQRHRLTSVILILMSLLGNGVALAKPAHTPANQLPIHKSSDQGVGSDEPHAHKTLEIPAGQPVPTVKLIVHPDAVKGWNLEMQVTNFRFAPEQVNTTSSTTEGHAHLYINGKKITRLYSAWYYLASLAPGKHEIKVTLNANGHETLVHNRQPIEATAMIQVPTARQ
jgi:hypothetical protein